LQVQNKDTCVFLRVIIIEYTLNKYIISVNYRHHSFIISL